MAVNHLKAPEQSLAKLHSATMVLATLDSLALADFMFTGTTAFGLLNRPWAARFSASGQKLLSRFNWVLLGTLPANFWLSDQANAQLRNASANGQLLVELQKLLLSASEELTVRLAERTLRGVSLAAMTSSIQQAKQELLSSQSVIETYLTETQTRSETLLTNRLYRVPDIAVETGIGGMGVTGIWMLTRHFLYKASGGVILPTLDKYSKGMFKFFVVLAAYAYPADRAIERDIALTTEDFFVLHNAYYSSVIQVELLKQVEAAAVSGRPLPAPKFEVRPHRTRRFKKWKPIEREC